MPCPPSLSDPFCWTLIWESFASCGCGWKGKRVHSSVLLGRAEMQEEKEKCRRRRRRRRRRDEGEGEMQQEKEEKWRRNARQCSQLLSAMSCQLPKLGGNWLGTSRVNLLGPDRLQDVLVIVMFGPNIISPMSDSARTACISASTSEASSFCV